MIDAKEENFLIFETLLAGCSLSLACLLPFVGRNVLSVYTL